MIYISMNFCMNFLFSVEVFLYFCGETNKYFILHQKNILRYCVHLYHKHKELFSIEHFLKHSSFGDILILLFACTYISYVEEQKKPLK